MKLTTFTYLDLVKELFIFAVIICAFQFSPDGFGNVVYWFLWVIAVLSFVAALGNHERAYTQNKANFETYTLILLCGVIAYFGFYALATVLFIGNLLFIGSCLKNAKE